VSLGSGPTLPEEQQSPMPLDFISSEWLIPGHELQAQAQIGKGFFGVVYRGLWNGSTVAIKKIYRALPQGQWEMFAREIKIISSLRSPNTVLFMGICPTDTDVLLITEFLVCVV
jgi:serine/threonine protein kinase